MKKSVGNTIKERLRALGKTQNWLAEHADVSKTAVSKWVSTGKISRSSAIEVAKLLQVSLNDLLDSEATGAGNASAPPTLSLVYVDAEELRLITAFREASPMGKALISVASESAPRAELIDLSVVRNKP